MANPSISDIKALAGDYQRKTSEYDAKGKVTKRDGSTIYVKLDGSSIETPVESTTTDVSVGDTVSVHVSHDDTHITGNRTNPAATVYTVVEAKSELDDSIRMQDSKIEAVGADVRIVNSAFQITDGVITGLSGAVLDSLGTRYLEADWANINIAEMQSAKVKDVLQAGGIIANRGEFYELSGVEIDARNIEVRNLDASSISTGWLSAENIRLFDDETGKTSLITALNAESKIMEGGLLDGAIVTDSSIAAAKIDVADLNAFNATIGGFEIGSKSIHSGTREGLKKLAYDDPTGGVYVGMDGIGIGDGYATGLVGEVSYSNDELTLVSGTYFVNQDAESMTVLDGHWSYDSATHQLNVTGSEKHSPIEMNERGYFALRGSNGDLLLFDPMTRTFALNVQDLAVGTLGTGIATQLDDIYRRLEALESR